MRINNQDRFEVNQVLRNRKRRSRNKTIEQYQVSFVKYGPEYNIWLPLSLLHCPEMIEEYKGKNRARIKAKIGKRAIAGIMLSILTFHKPMRMIGY